MRESNEVLNLDSISHQFPDGVEALSDINFSVQKGEFIAIIGESGSGKTTLLNIIANLILPSSGSMIYNGSEVTDSQKFQKKVGLVFQDFSLYPNLTVFENIYFPLRFLNSRGLFSKLKDTFFIDAKKKRTVLELIKSLGLSHRLNSKPMNLSGGEKQRVAIGRALIKKPQLLLLDEPFANLDKSLRFKLKLELSRIHKNWGLTTVIVSHDIDEAISLADRMIILDAGKIHQIGTSDELFSQPASLFVAKLVFPESNLIDLEKNKGFLTFLERQQENTSLQERIRSDKKLPIVLVKNSVVTISGTNGGMDNAKLTGNVLDVHRFLDKQVVVVQTSFNFSISLSISLSRNSPLVGEEVCLNLSLQDLVFYDSTSEEKL